MHLGLLSISKLSMKTLFTVKELLEQFLESFLIQKYVSQIFIILRMVSCTMLKTISSNFSQKHKVGLFY